ncbi:MAG TPA: ClbS/DfsB family four-helix bundle protein [Candidatus Enterococcus stercoravium]|nr:ClbS/DfsB family four-helix bundle protein [Candidatus Enterococcus stercoravium]
MARAKNKQELLDGTQRQYEKLFQLIDDTSDWDQLAPFAFSEEFLQKKKETHWRRDQNLRDVLIHLYEWQQLLLYFVRQNSQGVATSFLPAPYNWRSYGKMNEGFVAKHQKTSLAEAKDLLARSHEATFTMIERFSDEELFTKQFFSWTGSSTLGSYCISATSSHYDWAIKKWQAYLKQQFVSKK